MSNQNSPERESLLKEVEELRSKLGMTKEIDLNSQNDKNLANMAKQLRGVLAERAGAEKSKAEDEAKADGEAKAKLAEDEAKAKSKADDEAKAKAKLAEKSKSSEPHKAKDGTEGGAPRLPQNPADEQDLQLPSVDVRSAPPWAESIRGTQAAAQRAQQRRQDGERSGRQPTFVVAPKKSISTSVGIKGPGEPIAAEVLEGGEENLRMLFEAGLVVAKP